MSNNALKSLLKANKVAVVSVNRSFNANDTLGTAREYAKGSWSNSIKSAYGVDYLVAVKSGLPVAIWKVLDVYIDERATTKRRVNGGKRIAFDLGEPLVISPEIIEWFLSDDNTLNMQTGCQFV